MTEKRVCYRHLASPFPLFPRPHYTLFFNSGITRSRRKNGSGSRSQSQSGILTLEGSLVLIWDAMWPLTFISRGRTCLFSPCALVLARPRLVRQSGTIQGNFKNSQAASALKFKIYFDVNCFRPGKPHPRLVRAGLFRVGGFKETFKTVKRHQCSNSR